MKRDGSRGVAAEVASQLSWPPFVDVSEATIDSARAFLYAASHLFTVIITVNNGGGYFWKISEDWKIIYAPCNLAGDLWARAKKSVPSQPCHGRNLRRGLF